MPIRLVSISCKLRGLRFLLVQRKTTSQNARTADFRKIAYKSMGHAVVVT